MHVLSAEIGSQSCIGSLFSQKFTNSGKDKKLIKVKGWYCLPLVALRKGPHNPLVVVVVPHRDPLSIPFAPAGHKSPGFVIAAEEVPAVLGGGVGRAQVHQIFQTACHQSHVPDPAGIQDQGLGTSSSAAAVFSVVKTCNRY